MPSASEPFVSRAGRKLSAALDAFEIDVRGLVCADFGCNVGGFTDCLLQRGAAKVYAVDTGYGELAWRLRKDARIVVMERTNALYCPVPEPVDLVTIDVAWTPQELSVPAALGWLKRPQPPTPVGHILSLLKPHYEIARLEGKRPHEALSPRQSRLTCLEICRRLQGLGYQVRAVMRSVILGKGGNEEYLLWISPADAR